MASSGSVDLSLMGLTIQVLGVASIALLFQLLHRALPRDYFRLWSKAWLVMAVALVALRLALAYPGLLWPLELVYFMGEYWFAVLLAAGFVRYPDRDRLPALARRWPWLLALLWALLLSRLPMKFSARFGVHALVFAGLLGYAWWRLRALRLPHAHRWAHLFALAGLALLVLDFLGNGLVQLVYWFSGEYFTASYSAYQSIVDLFIEVLVAFGLVAIAAVDMRTTLERARAAMQGERDRMSMLAHQDALTGCFNRLALEGLKARLEQRHGSVAMIDLNRLKPLNDHYGHALGDLAICQVANALKTGLRHHDHVFRSGGDEFVLVCFDLPKNLALQRLAQAQAQLQATVLYPGHKDGLGIAYGVAEFGGSSEFDAALAEADAAMYAHKQSGRSEPPR